MKVLLDNREYLMEHINKIIHGNCLEKLKELPENSIDSIVTDPPYELGFMGKSWDSTGIANNPLMWAECLRVLKPGGYLLSFGGTRTYHRMACAIEDAGFEVRDMIEWVYGSGFPKSLNIWKAIDKMQGNEREIVGETRIGKTSMGDASGWDTSENMKAIKESGSVNITKGTSEWEGWGTALKPAHEPICLARKPLSEKTVASNVLKYGTGGINIDESRVEYQGEADKQKAGTHGRSESAGKETQQYGQLRNGIESEKENTRSGRFPANLIHDNSEEVRECFPESTSGAKKANQENYNHEGKEFVATLGASINEYQASSGNASRFFKSIIYQAKASKSERNNGCEELEEKQKAGAEFRPNHQEKANNGETGNPFGRWNKVVNNHPTVKPIALMEYLIKMVTPKGGIVLDPFAGSGSTLVAAKQNGFNYVGIEMTEEYLPIINARLGL